VSHKQNDIWLEMEEEMRHEPMECACGEISLEYESVTSRAPFMETWSCAKCGHIRCFHVKARPMAITRGWGENISHAYHCSACGSQLDMSELEKQKQEWWAQQDQDSEWIEENG
jgi:hypothetical protein